MSRKRLKVACAILIFIVIALICTGSVAGQSQPSCGNADADRRLAANAIGPVDPRELEAFLDSVIGKQLAENHVAGATIAVVRDGRLFFVKGYGYANVAGRTPVDPGATLFRIGSVTKLFTWTAVMQLVERGKLDLDADVNTYLDFRIPDTYKEPITLKHLMSHTPGFEDIAFGLKLPSADQLQPLGQWLASHVPARVRPPGQVTAYSNYGTSLAGYIVERASGMPFADYVEANILLPLDMRNTTTRQPLPSELADRLSSGYRYANGAYQEQSFELLSAQPEGAMSATATDMARFMIAHLQYGRYDGTDGQGSGRILQETTARRMQSTLFKSDPRLNGFTYGFWEMDRDRDGDRDGQFIIGHPGDTLLFQSMLALLPGQGVGLFVSYNTAAGQLAQPLLYAFLDHYYPAPALPPAKPQASFAARAGEYTGSYRLSRSAHTNVEKANGLLISLEVSAAGDGTLVAGSPLSPQKFHVVEVGPLLFREIDTGILMAFIKDDAGNVSRIVVDDRPDQTWLKLAWYENPTFHYVLLLICAVLFLSVLVAAPISLHSSRLRKTGAAPQPRPAHLARWLLGIAVLLNLAALVAFFGPLVTDYNAFTLAVVNGDASGWAFSLVAWTVAAVLTAAAVVCTAVIWKRRYFNLAGRIHYTLVTAAALAFVWFLNYWNLLGWRV